MIKSSANFYNSLLRFGRIAHTPSMLREAKHIKDLGGIKRVNALQEMFKRNLQAVESGKPFDQRFIDAMSPTMQEMFYQGKIPARTLRRAYKNSAPKYKTGADQIIASRNERFMNYANDPALAAKNEQPLSSLPRAERRNILRYIQGRSSGNELPATSRFSKPALDKWMRREALSFTRPIFGSPAPITPYHKELNILNREDLIRASRANKQPLDKKQLREQFYSPSTTVENSLQHPAGKLLMAPSPITAIKNEMALPSHAEIIESMGPLPKSVHRALDIVKGQNILEPGTRANRFYTALSNSENPNIQKLLNSLSMDQVGAELATGEQALYHRIGNFIAVPKEFAKYRGKPMIGRAAAEAHEKGHFFAHNLSEAEHKALATSFFTRLAKAQRKLNLDIPFNDPKLMQEAFATGYAADVLKQLDPLSIATNRLKHIAAENFTGQKHIGPAYRKLLKDFKLMNNSPDIDATTKQMLNQLFLNYGHNIFSKWV